MAQRSSDGMKMSFRGENKQTPHQQLRMLQLQAKKVQDELREQERSNTRLQQRLSLTNRQAVLHRVQFLKIYSNKKAKYQAEQLQQEHQRSLEQSQLRSHDKARRIKLEMELQQVLMQNEQEEHVARLQSQRRERREGTQRELMALEMKERIRRKRDGVMRVGEEREARRESARSAVAERGRMNYLGRVGREWDQIQRYEGVIDQIEQLTNQTLRLPSTSTPANSEIDLQPSQPFQPYKSLSRQPPSNPH